jgi:predicted ATPase/DNA-binding SARP family transcriptional activator/Tfp pilus assembly protein PilF
MTHLWRVQLLGELCAKRGEQTLTRFRTQKTAGLLAYLAVYNERAHPREVLCDLFWPDAEIDTARHNLRLALSSLRSQLEPPGIPAGTVVMADRTHVQLRAQALTTDVAEFETALQAATNASRSFDKTERLVQALELYAGDLLPGHYEEWILPQQLRLKDAYAQALVQLADLLCESGENARAIPYVQRALEADPTCEEFHLTLMRLRLAAGQPGAALRQYSRLEQALQENFGEPPSRMAQELAAQARQQSLNTPRTASVSAGPAATLPTPQREVSASARAAASNAASAAVPTPLGAESASLPTGTVTFLLTDIEGSTRSWQRAAEPFQQALEAHHGLLRAQFRHHAGHEVKEMGDGFLVAFQRAGDALACAIASQQALDSHAWPQEVGPVCVRMALDTADVEVKHNDYHALALHRAARLLAAAHGGQVLCSDATAGLLRRDLATGVLLTDLGLYRLRDLPEPQRLFLVDYPDRAIRDFPVPNAAPAYSSTLPMPLTRFFGREQETTQIAARLADTRHLPAPPTPILSGTPDTRLLTLTGPGGTGKTRLSLEVAHRLAESCQEAVWFVPLADITDARLIPTTIQTAMNLPRAGNLDALEQVVQALSTQASLLVLDNFEQLVEEGSGLVQTMLERVPDLTCLVTSRRRLNLAGEREFLVPPLPTPDTQDNLETLSRNASVQLFVDRAQSARPDFQITRTNARATAELCSRLEGIPLALELAAARAKVMSPAQMLGQLANRLDFFASRQREVTQRHRTLRAAIDWSYRLLTPELQQLFARLSVFRGGWTAEAAEQVCEEGQCLDYLAELQESSLILAEEQGEEVRFRMLETLREYAGDQLSSHERDRLQERYGDYFLQFAEEAETHLSGTDQADWLTLLDLEHDNLRAALQFSRGEQGEAGMRLCGALQRFWWTRGYLAEGRAWCEAALGAQGAQERTAARAKALNGAGVLAWHHGDWNSAWAYHEESLAIQREIGDRQGVAASLNSLGNAARNQGDYASARVYFEESLAIQREIRDRSGIARSLHNLGMMAGGQGDYTSARAYFEESLAIRREIGDRSGIADSLGNLGTVVHAQGDCASARAYYEESLAIQREIGERQGIAYSLKGLGNVAYSQGDYVSARAYYVESLVIKREIGERQGIAYSLKGLGTVAWNQGDYASARAYYEESLTIQWEIGNRQGIAYSLEAFAALTVAEVAAVTAPVGTAGVSEDTSVRMRRAARLWGSAQVLREQIGAPLPPVDQAELEQQIAAMRERLGEADWTATWAQGHAMTMEQTVAYALSEEPDV